MSNSKEKIRQEKITFEVRKQHIQNLNMLRIIMGYSSIFVLIVIIVMCVYIFCESEKFESLIVRSAAIAFFVDFFSLIVLTYKMVFSSQHKDLEPTCQN